MMLYSHARPAEPDAFNIEPFPFPRSYEPNEVNECAADPFFQSVLEVLLTLEDASDDYKAPVMSQAWPQLATIKIPAENAIHLMRANEVVMTPDDQRALPSLVASGMSPGGGASRKRLRVEMTKDKGEGFESTIDEGDEEDIAQERKRLLTNSRRDAVMLLREEARALEATLKSLHLRQSRPKPVVSDDPNALIKSYAQNIQLKRAIEEQDVKIKTLRRAVSLREGQVAPDVKARGR